MPHPNLQPLQLLLAILAGWMVEHQARAIDYLREEPRPEGAAQGQAHPLHRLPRLAADGKAVDRKLLGEIATIVTPENILAWP